ncbi:MAG: hypothetical protein NC548_05450 [Lachnospiraceae bacterium]|nr:hypothetical protein [Lachnospiraceae bacterium]
MADSKNISLICGDAIAMEAINDCTMCMETKDRLHYREIILEAMASDEKNIALVYQLYRDVASKMDGQNTETVLKLAEKTKGDFTKYDYYPVVIQCIKILEGFECNELESIQLVQKLKNILLKYREDFSFGYKHNKKVIIKMYVETILALNLMIDCAIADVAHAKELTFNAKRQAKPKTARKVVKHVKVLISAYESGLFTSTLKGAKKAMAAGTLPTDGDAVATEASIHFGWNSDTKTLDLNGAADTLSIKKGIMDAFGLFKNAVNFLLGSNNPAVWVARVIALLLSLRFLWSWFNHGMARLSDFARNQASLVKASIDSDKASGNDPNAKQIKMYNFMSGLADTIDYKILKIDNDTERVVAKDNRDTMGPEAINNTINGLDFS